MYKYNFWNKSIARLKKLRQIAKADDGVHSIEEILLAKKAVKKPKEEKEDIYWESRDNSKLKSHYKIKGDTYYGDSAKFTTDHQPSSVEECHCGKNGHALNSINCPVHSPSKPRIEPIKGTVYKIVRYLKHNLSCGESYERGEVYLRIGETETTGSGMFDWDDEFWLDVIEQLLDLLNSEK